MTADRESLFPSRDPRYEVWFVDETQEDAAVIYVKRTTHRGEPFAHVLFEADWGDMELAEHIAKLHNEWLSKEIERRTELEACLDGEIAIRNQS